MTGEEGGGRSESEFVIENGEGRLQAGSAVVGRRKDGRGGDEERMRLGMVADSPIGNH